MKSSTLSNIGTKVEEDLAKLEIYTVEDFLQYSIYEIYFKMQCINKKWRNKMLVYALFGAVNNVNCIILSNAEKNHINQEYKKYINLANE